jgi:hypothetical protein
MKSAKEIGIEKIAIKVPNLKMSDVIFHLDNL